MSIENNLLTFEDVQLVYRNFTGAEGKYNAEGARSFGILLDEDTAKRLADAGWNVKFPKERLDSDEDGEDTRLPTLSVAINYGKSTPKVVLVSGGTPRLVHEEDLSLLDFADIVSADVVINPYHWEVNGQKGIKAYCKAIYITLEYNKFDEKYGV